MHSPERPVRFNKSLDDLRRYLLLPIFSLAMYDRDGSYCVGLLARLDVPDLPSGYVTVFERCFDNLELASEYMVQMETLARNVLGNLVIRKNVSHRVEVA
jgi:hypothetical protein